MNRPSAASRGYDSRWRTRRAHFLQRHPLCRMCEAEGKLTVASVVDHITPHKGNKALFDDQANWQSLCRHHHNSRKQSTERIGYDPTPGADGYPTDPRHPFMRKRGSS